MKTLIEKIRRAINDLPFHADVVIVDTSGCELVVLTETDLRTIRSTLEYMIKCKQKEQVDFECDNLLKDFPVGLINA